MPRRHSLKTRKCKTPNDLSGTSITEGRSILKKRQRKPLQEVVDLHLTGDTKPETNARSNSRRVSFAVSEVKEFRQPANEGTLWGSSYFVDIQKSSSESENTESSASGFQTSSGSCGSGLIYSQQVIVQETVSVSYSDIDESEEFRGDLPDAQSNRVCELIDVANQTDESVFQVLNNCRDTTKKGGVRREVVPTYLQHANNERKFMDPSEMLGDFLQSKPIFSQTIPCETFERQTLTTLPYSLTSIEIDSDKENASLRKNTPNRDHVTNFSEPSGISQKHPLSLCDDSFEIAKKQKFGTHVNDIKLLDWLKEEEMAAVRKQQTPICINNQLGASNQKKNPHSHDHVEYNMQNFRNVSKQPLINENEISNNSSDDMSMSFTLSNAPLLNISSTNIDGSTSSSITEFLKIDPGTAKLNSEKTPVLSDYNNGPLENRSVSISPKVSKAYFIEKNDAPLSRGQRVDNEVSSCKDKYSDVCVKRMLGNEVEGGKNSCTNNSFASNHGTSFENITRSVSPTVNCERVLGNIELSNHFSNCENVTKSISETADEEIDLIGVASVHNVSNLDNISGGVSLTMPEGKIQNNYVSRHEAALEFKRIGSPIISSKSVLNNAEDATQNLINMGSNCERTISQITTENKILCNTQPSRLGDVSGNTSPTMPVGQILNHNASFYSGCPINIRNKLPTMVREKLGRRLIPAEWFEIYLNDKTAPGHVPYFQDTIPIYSFPVEPQEGVFSNVTHKNYICSLGNLKGSEFFSESEETIFDKKEISDHYCNFRNGSKSISPTMPTERIVHKIHVTDEHSDFVNISGSLSPTMPMGRFIGEGQSSLHISCKDISGVSVSPTLATGRILSKLHMTSENSNFANANRSLSPTMPMGRIISEHQSSPHTNCKDISATSESPTLPAGRIFDTSIRTDKTSEWSNASKSVSPNMHMGRIISHSQSSPHANCKDISAISATLPIGRILDKINRTDESSEWVNASRSDSPALPFGTIGQCQSSPCTSCKDISGIKVSLTLPAGRILDKVHTTDQNSDFVNANRSVSPTMPMGRIISLGQSGKNNDCNDISKVSPSRTLCAERILGKIMEANEPSDFVNAGRSVSPTVPLGRILSLGQSCQSTDCKDISEVSALPMLHAGRILEKINKTDESSNCVNACRSVSPTMPMGRIIEENNTSKNIGFEDTHRSVSPTISVGRVFHNNHISCDNVELAPIVVRENIDEQGVFSNCALLKMASVRDLESTLPLQECNPDTLSKSSNENISPSISKEYTAMGDNKVSLTETLRKMFVAEKFAVEGFIENDKEFPHHNPRKEVEMIFNAQGTNAIVDSNVFYKTCNTNKELLAICGNELKDTQDHSDCKKVQIGFDNSITRMVETSNKNVGNRKATVDKIERTSCNLKEENIDLPVIKINEISMDFSESTGSINNPAAVICKGNMVEVVLDTEKDFIEQKNGGNSPSSNMNYRNCSRIKFKEVPNFEENGDHSERTDININDEHKMDVDECFVSSQTTCHMKSTEQENNAHYSNSLTNGKVECEGSNVGRLCETKNTGLINNGSQTNSKNTNDICIDDNCGKEVMPCSDGEMIRKVKSAKDLVISTNESTNEIIDTCDEKSNINVNKEETNEENQNSKMVETVSEVNRPSLCISGIDYIDWKSSLDATEALVNISNKSRSFTVFPDTQRGIPEFSISIVKTGENNNRSEIEESDISESSLISLSNIHDNEFDGANDILIKSFRNKGRNDLLKERSTNSFSFHNEVSKTGIFKTPCKVEIEVNSNKLKIPQFVQPVTKFMNVDVKSTINTVEVDLSISENEPPMLKVPLVQSEDDRDINSSSDHARSIPSDILQPQDYIETIYSSPGISAKSDIVIHDEMIKVDVKKSVELPLEPNGENKTEMQEIHPHTPLKSSVQINCNDEQYSPLQKKTKFSPQVAPSLSTRLSYYESFFSKENQIPTSTSLKRNYSYVFGYKGTTNDLSSQVFPPVNFERWIQERESKKCSWKVECISSSKINFFFLEKTVKVYVEIDPSNLNLSKIDIKSHLKGNNTIIFLHNLFLKRLKLETLQVRFRSKNDIPALIDFISTEEEFILDFAQDWLDLEIKNAIQMKENFCAEFEVTSLLVSWLCIIKIDLSSWNGERLHSRYVQVCPVIGEINDGEIKRLMRAIPGGPHLLKNYVSHLHSYIYTKEKFEGKESFG